MKKNILLLIFAVLLGYSSSAQFFLGLRASNYGGITNVNYNPAIADNRLKFDMNLVNVGFGLNNNYVGLDRKAIFNTDYFSDPDFQTKYLKERLNGRAKNVYIGLQVQAPLSFMFSFGKNNKNAIAVSAHANMVTNIDGVGEPMARIAYFGLGDEAQQYFRQDFENKKLVINSATWADYGITYSRVVYDKGANMVKVGGTLKLLQGLGAAYLYSDNFQYRFSSDDTLSITNTDVSYGHTENYNFMSQDYKPAFKFDGRPSVGGDLAFVYEWRPKKEKYRYSMDGRDDLYRRDKNLYTIQTGLSIIDIGAINYKRMPTSQNVYANIRDWYIKNLDFSDGVQSFDDTLRTKFQVVNPTENLRIWLPTRFNLWVDAQVGAGFGFTASAMLSYSMPKTRNQVHHVSTFVINPHYDHSWFGAYLPFSADVYGNYNLGMTLRLGPVIIGTQDLLNFFAKKYVRSADVHLALKVPIPYAMPKDKDKDGVSNRKDNCKKTPGPWATKGCPDRDGDGVTDDKDLCPDIVGPVDLHGCPDTDGDGLIDPEDSCITIKGLMKFHGCPDSDSDDIMDALDACPFEPGLPEFNGCPDRDKDGVPDKSDLCPDIPGDKAHAGCPDTDADGVYDNEDRCINTPGPKENNGCPWPDSDADGIPDKDDQCPKTAGVPENKGCPVLAKKELETVKFAFDNLEFETGKDVIRTKSYPSLNSLATLLISKPEYGLRIDGHTDNVGTAEKNQVLSEKRATSVKNYLVKRGVDASKLESNGYGLTKPIADNATPAGRQKNRRVEMTITFK